MNVGSWISFTIFHCLLVDWCKCRDRYEILFFKQQQEKKKSFSSFLSFAFALSFALPRLFLSLLWLLWSLNLLLLQGQSRWKYEWQEMSIEKWVWKIKLLVWVLTLIIASTLRLSSPSDSSCPLSSPPSSDSPPPRRLFFTICREYGVKWTSLL